MLLSDQRKILFVPGVLLAILTIVAGNVALNAKELPEFLHKLAESESGIQIERAADLDSEYQGFLLKIRQPLDHQAPQKGAFWQRVYLLHRSIDAPMVMVHQGYAASADRISEPAALLQANQIRIEHRFFGESLPDSLNWEYLTIRQSAADEYRILSLLKPLYTQAWLNTGISKGGQSALFYKRFYPQSVAVTIAYVAPMNLAAEDPRLNQFLKTVGDEECRRALQALQRRFLQNRESLLPLLQQWSVDREDPFVISLPEALEYAVLEYTFSFWQYAGLPCDSLPGEQATPQTLFDNLKTVVGLNLFTESGRDRFSPFYYQAYHEMGYYSYNSEHLADLLIAAPKPDNSIFIPTSAEKPDFDSATMRDIHQWLTTQGNNIVYIYGETDAWSATAMTPGSETNALKMVKTGGDHSTRIASFDEVDQRKIMTTVERWLAEAAEPGWRRYFFVFNAVLMIAVVLLVLWAVNKRASANPS